MNWIDIVALATLLLLILFGFKRGLIREVGSLLAVLLALGLSLLIIPFASRALPRILPFPQKFTPWVVALVVFFLLLFLFQILIHLVHTAVHATPLGLLDRLGGAAFGGLKGLVVIGFFLLILTFLPLPRPARVQLKGSLLFSAVSDLRPTLTRLTTRWVRKRIQRAPPSKEAAKPEAEGAGEAGQGSEATEPQMGQIPLSTWRQDATD